MNLKILIINVEGFQKESMIPHTAVGCQKQYSTYCDQSVQKMLFPW